MWPVDDNGWLYTILLSAAFIVIFILGELFFHYLKIKTELTRKFVHVSSGLLTLAFPLLLENHWQALFLCSSFALLLFISIRYNFLKSINKVGRTTWGSFLFPASVYICFHSWLYTGSLLYFYAPMLVLAISDPLAALCGKKWPAGKYTVFHETKTLTGSAAFFISAFLIILLLMRSFTPDITFLKLISFSIILSFFSTVAEALSQKGTDNLSIPLTLLLLLFVL
ncbi:MAG: phosphatidate cytidylyltransferase [Bacteroidota bacterium]